MSWYNPISYTVVYFGEMAIKRYQIDTLLKLHNRAARIVAYYNDNRL